ncbi:HET-domain-containing protein [Leucogyrophana mollusca]|uniref:HET-domain-containing protein n=1 Tax=Leucogyrophana mollusca TaxID=85980 RepID=A0ACB8BYY2_9AGAM|nr:HET-domain-containing protein [Leucogyrophana mollusca]
MRLLNTKTLKLEEPAGPRLPPYAILSHVWGNEEVTLRDIGEHGTGKKVKGNTKIENCCVQALEDGYRYVWIDTCCIDKCSSAELSEAINSMYRWYQEAAVCYAYLEDVPSDEDPAAEDSSFRRSKWFRRGWTLQETIAPRNVEFFARDWVKIGTKTSLIDVIATVTRVDTAVLMNTLPLSEVCVAKKMSWASRRETRRVEDRAYSMMGIFGVHMPLIYGEGKNAFIRLQHEIMRTSNDQSIFAWLDPPWYSGYRLEPSLLAPSPDCFAQSNTINRIPSADFARLFEGPTSKPTPYKSHFSVTNSGVQINLPVRFEADSNGYTAALACVINGCLVGLRLSCGTDGIFRREDTSDFSNTTLASRDGELDINGDLSNITLATPSDVFVIRDIIISTAVEKQTYSRTHFRPLPSLPYRFPEPPVYVRTAQVAQEGFVLHRCSGKDLRTQPEGSFVAFVWEPWPPSRNATVKCTLAYENPVSGEGFIVTISQLGMRLPCVHIAAFTDGKRAEYLFESSYLESPCCESHPDWASMPLRSGRRVTVATSNTEGWKGLGPSGALGVTISVGRTQSAKARNKKPFWRREKLLPRLWSTQPLPGILG